MNTLYTNKSNDFMLTKSIRYLALLFLGMLFFSCKDKINMPDISHIEKPAIKLVRTEQILNKLDTNQLNIANQLNQEDQAFFDIYFNQVLGFNYKDMQAQDRDRLFKSFQSDSRIQFIQSEVDKKFRGFEREKEDLETMFRLIKYYFPNYKTPSIYTYISEYAIQQFLFENKSEDGIGIGLDLYLGKDFPYNQYVPNNTSFSAYQLIRYDKKYLVRNIAEAIVDDWMGQQSNGENLLEKMIFNGRKLYIISKILPNLDEADIMLYTDKQQAWCEDQEDEMWAHFMREKLFYNADIRKIGKLVSPSPHSPGMPPEAPGRTGNYLGLQIIKSLAKRKKLSVQDVLELDKLSAQKILEESKFKPKR